MENPEIGGIPIGMWAIKKYLPRGAKRKNAIRNMSIILTYITYLVFSAARRPITVVQMKIIEECNVSLFHNFPKLESQNGSDWCSGSVFERNPQEIMVLLASLYIGSYAVCLYISGCIADYFNPRYYVSSGCIFGSFFSIILGLANVWKIANVEYFSMALILFAAAQATAWPVMLACASHWYSGERYGLFFAAWNTHSYVGSIFGVFIAGSFVDTGWGWSFFVPGFLLGLMSFFVFFFLVAHPADLKNYNAPKRRIFEATGTEEQAPAWLDSWRSLDYYQAFEVPGVIEFSACMFFSRMVSYTFQFWTPFFLGAEKQLLASNVAFMNAPYILGGLIGGVLSGILKDLYRRSALICILFLALSIIAIGLQMVSLYVGNVYLITVFQVILGIFVEGPYVLLSTSISADLGKHSLIRRGHRGLATVASIVEGTGALGSTIGPYANSYFLHYKKWGYSLLFMMIMELFAIVCLIRMAKKELQSPVRRLAFSEYWRS